jgi:hypothetical protein
MPIVVEAVPKDRFEAWVTEAQAKFAKVDGRGGGVSIADAAAAAPRPAN